MAVTYVRAVPEYASNWPDAVPGLRVLFFEPVLERGVAPIGDRYRQIDPTLRSADVVIIRGGRGVHAAVESDPILRQELSGRSVVVLAPVSDLEWQGAAISNPSWSRQGNSGLVIQTLADLELKAIIERTGALLGHVQEHFEIPSGWHAERFLRIGDALNDPVDVTRLVQWVLPHLGDRSVVLADTGGLLPLLFALQAEVLRRMVRTIEIEALQQYPADVAFLARVVGGLQSRHPAGILCLVSVDATRRLVRLFRSMATIEDKVLVLCDTSSVDDAIEVEAVGSMPIRRWRPDAENSCAICNTTHLVHINSSTYRPEANIQWRTREFSPDLMSEHEAFWTSVDRTGAVSLHRDVAHEESGQIRARHFPVHLDIAQLLTDPEFRAVCVQRLQGVGEPDLVLIPQHPATLALTALVSEAFAGAAVTPGIVVVSSGHFDADTRRRAGGARHILIVDDALVTSHTAMSLRDEVYGTSKVNGTDPRVDFFAAVGRPESDETITNVRRRYRQPNSNRVHFGEILLLPRVAHRDCPWCHEHSLLSLYLPKLSGPSANLAQQRIRQLDSSLSTPLTFGVPAVGERTEGSYLGALRDITAFAAASSVALRVRPARGKSVPTGIREIAPTPLILTAFRDATILGGFLRTLRPVDLRTARMEPEIISAVEQLSHDRLNSALACEIAWAAVNAKVPPVPIMSLLERADVQPEIRDLFRDLFRLNLMLTNE